MSCVVHGFGADDGVAEAEGTGDETQSDAGDFKPAGHVPMIRDSGRLHWRALGHSGALGNARSRSEDEVALDRVVLCRRHLSG